MCCTGSWWTIPAGFSRSCRKGQEKPGNQSKAQTIAKFQAARIPASALMSYRRLLIVARAILTGWSAIWVIAYLVERPLLGWTARWLGGSWFATARIALDCV